MSPYLSSTILAFVFAPLVLASCASSGQYNAIPSFVGAAGCAPLDSFWLQIVPGTVTQAQLVSTCEAQCTSYGASCQAFVGLLESVPFTNLYIGQCLYYKTPPTRPLSCPIKPSIIVAESKDSSLQCFSSSASASAATAYCSSYLSIGTVTSYTSTYTPLATSTIVSAATTVTSKTSSNTASVSYTPKPVTNSFTSVAVTTQYSLNPNVKRAATSINPPACLASNALPSSRISSACSCLSITSATSLRVLTAPTSTVTTTATSLATSVAIIDTTSTVVLTQPTPQISSTTLTTSTLLSLTIGTGCQAICARQLSSQSGAASDCSAALASTYTSTTTQPAM
jgi:hypothetical protein